jgi:hypothetical protein
MKIRRSLVVLLACSLGACAFHSSADRKGEAQLPRLQTGPAEPPGITGQLSLCGLTVVGNADGLHFRLELPGERVSVRKGSPSDVFVVDGLKVQVSTMVADRINPTARQLTGIPLLRLHARFESARLSEAQGREVQPEEIAVLTADNMPSGLVWWSAGLRPEASAAAESPSAESPSAETPSAEAQPQAGGYPAAPPAAPGPAAAAPAPAPAPKSDGATGIAYVTAAFGPRILLLSVQGSHDEAKSALLAKAQAWMSSLTASSQVVSANQAKQEIGAAKAAGKTCPGRPNAVLEP